MTTPLSQTNLPAKTSPWAAVARLAAAVLMSVLLAPSASAQFIYVANAGEDTVSKIDINSNTEVARYATWFTSGTNQVPAHLGNPIAGPAPSRLLQDSAGYLYVLNRFFSPSHRPVLLKIAPSGGTATTTSNGAGITAVLPMLDNGTVNNEIDANDTKDARIVWGKSIGIANTSDEDALGRALCMDTTGVLWVGLYGKVLTNGSIVPGSSKYYRVDATTGQMLLPSAGVPVPAGHTPYGCQVDTNGKLWSVGSTDTLVEIDTTVSTYPATPHYHGANFGQNYAVSLLKGCGLGPSKVYLSERGLAKTYIAYDPQIASFSNAPAAIPQFNSYAIAVDLNGDIVSGDTFTGRVIKTTPSGGIVWDVKPQPFGPGEPSTNLHGIIIDEHNDVWAVLLQGNKVVKYSGGNGQLLAKVNVGDSPYTYGNPPLPTCPCAQVSEQQIKCKGKTRDGKWLYEWSFVVTNHSPFSAPATTVDISIPTGSPVTDLTPGQFALSPALPPNGHATVSGTFTLAQPIPGTQVCLDIRLNAGLGWCCPLEHVCFVVPDCTCATLEGVFKCSHGRRYLELSVTNLGPTAAAGVQVFSNTAGVTITPSMTMQNFPQNTAVTIPLTVTGATPGQVISLSVMLHGPLDEKTGVFSWCCTATVKLTYPNFPCHWWPDGWIFDDVNANGIRDSGEGGLPEWAVTLTDAKGKLHTTKSDASGKYQFEEIEPGKYRLSVQPPKGWRSTTLKRGVNSLSVEESPKGPADFGFVKTRP